MRGFLEPGQLILTLKDYIDIGNFSGSIMGDQIVGPDFVVDVINHSCMVLRFK